MIFIEKTKIVNNACIAYHHKEVKSKKLVADE
uniref:Uncharacterized protein n=1 Tax=virus sp. ctLTC15 TaxID=2826801 RepID=A0A8S5R8N7_9VIRU|nr:MAG TPA: hypothetical protein [virus sp. ctLTC15]